MLKPVHHRRAGGFFVAAVRVESLEHESVQTVLGSSFRGHVRLLTANAASSCSRQFIVVDHRAGSFRGGRVLAALALPLPFADCFVASSSKRSNSVTIRLISGMTSDMVGPLLCERASALALAFAFACCFVACVRRPISA